MPCHQYQKPTSQAQYDGSVNDDEISNDSEDFSEIEQIFLEGFSMDSFIKLNKEHIKICSDENNIITLLNTWKNATGDSYSGVSTGISFIRIH